MSNVSLFLLNLSLTLNLNLSSNWIDVNYNIEKNENQVLIGLQNKFINNKNIAGTGILPLIPNYTLLNPAVYLMYKSKINKSIIYEIGGRYEIQNLIQMFVTLIIDIPS